MIDETVRLYSRETKCAVDVVAPQHDVIHADLERWGTWNRDRYRPGSCTSMEKNYRRTRANDQGMEYPRLPIAMPINPRNREIDRAVLRLPEQHRETVSLFYVKRKPPELICRLVVVRWTHFPRWMFDCRAGVLNLLRFLS